MCRNGVVGKGGRVLNNGLRKKQLLKRVSFKLLIGHWVFLNPQSILNETFFFISKITFVFVVLASHMIRGF